MTLPVKKSSVLLVVVTSIVTLLVGLIALSLVVETRHANECTQRGGVPARYLVCLQPEVILP